MRAQEQPAESHQAPSLKQKAPGQYVVYFLHSRIRVQRKEKPLQTTHKHLGDTPRFFRVFPRRVPPSSQPRNQTRIATSSHWQRRQHSSRNQQNPAHDSSSHAIAAVQLAGRPQRDPSMRPPSVALSRGQHTRASHAQPERILPRTNTEANPRAAHPMQPMH